MKYNKYTYKGDFCFESGEHLDSLELVYHTSERERRPEDKVIWICHALTANSDASDWWPEMVGKAKLFDTEKYYVVCVNMLCSAYGSSGPASVDPRTGKPYMMSFPRTSVRDIVKANILVRKYLGIDKIDLLLGPSIGGFQALEWSVMEPDVIGNAVFLATGSRISPFMTAFNESQRMAMLADPTFTAAESLEGGKKGLACARSMALISYRTFEGYNITQQEQDEDVLWADRAASYQRYQGKKLVDRFDAYSYWYLTYSLDSHNLGRGRGGVEKALGMIKCPSTVICVTTDVPFPPKDGKAMASAIPNCNYAEIYSAFGHDGFLIEFDQLQDVLQDIVAKI